MQKRYFRYAVLGLCLANLLIFARFYITDYLPSVNLLKVPDAVYFSLYYPAKLLEFSLTPLTAVIAFSLFYDSPKKLAVSSALLTLPRAFYLIPYYYLYENAYGNDSLESLTLSLFITIFGFIVLFLHLALLLLIFRSVMQFLIKRELKAQNPYLCKKEAKTELCEKTAKMLPEEIAKKGFFDLSLPVIAGIFSVAFVEFLYPLINEIIRTVSFFEKYGTSYTVGEIFSIVFAFIFVLAELIAVHVLAVLLKNLTLRARIHPDVEKTHSF
jgi:hypothetical protein